jgi:L-cysteine/cystine lyase
VNLDSVRAGLPVLERVAYLNTGSFGPLPRRTCEAMAEQQLAELENGRSAHAYWELIHELRTSTRAALAHLLGSPAESVALAHSTTEGCNIVVTGLGLSPGDDVVTTDDEHFGLLGALHAAGVQPRTVSIKGLSDEAIVEAIRSQLRSRTRLVAVSHVTWTTGRLLPVAQVADVCRGRGVPLLVDGAQSVGAIPVDVVALGCDCYTVSGQKWLLGPDATGALYVRPDFTERLAVRFPSGYALASHDADAPVEFAAGAARFDPGAVPAPSLRGLLASLAFADEAGADRFERARAMAERCRALLAERFDVLTEPGQATLVSFRPGGDPEAVVASVARRGVVVRGFPGLDWIRASVGFWTSEEELDRLLDALPA